MNKKPKTRRRRNKRTALKKPRISKKRANKMKGGGCSPFFPATFTNAAVAAAPNSYLPFNNMQNDPNYDIINSRNTGNFLTGMFSGGKRGTRKFLHKKMRGGNVAQNISAVSNTVSFGAGSTPDVLTMSGAAGTMNAFSGSGPAYNNSPPLISPLA